MTLPAPVSILRLLTAVFTFTPPPTIRFKVPVVRVLLLVLLILPLLRLISPLANKSPSAANSRINSSAVLILKLFSAFTLLTVTALSLIMVILLPSPRAWIFCKLISPRALILMLPSVVVTTVLIPLLSFSSRMRSILPTLLLMTLT